MKKKLDVSQVAHSLRGESVFFPIKNGEPAPGQAGEPLENSDIAPKHQVTKAPELQSDIAPSNQITNGTGHQSTMAGSNLIAKTPTGQSSKALRHFSSYLRPETYKAWKLLATQREVNDYDVLQEALEQYLEQNST
jgi:hypothetical protein